MKRFPFLLLTALSITTSEAQETTRTTNAPAATRESLSLDDAIFFVKTDVGSGIAFLLEDTNGVWLVSNNSIFKGAEEYSIVNANGAGIPFPEQVEVAKERDLIRFRTDRPFGLHRADSCGFEEALVTFSQCETFDLDNQIQRLTKGKKNLIAQKTRLAGEKVRLLKGRRTSAITDQIETLDEDIKEIGEKIEEIDQKVAACQEEIQTRMNAKKSAEALDKGFLLNGKALALGPDRIEISAPITRYDSGGPVLNKHNEVIGISSHLIEGSGLPDWVIEGTRFEDTRRFALKLDDVDWMPMTRKDYERETLFVQENFETLMVFAQITELLDDNYFKEISIPTENRDVQQWIKVHNKLTDKYNKATHDVYYSQHDVDRAVRGIKRKIDKDYIALVEMLEDLENDAGRVHRVSIPFYQKQLIDLETLYCAIRERMEQIEENM